VRKSSSLPNLQNEEAMAGSCHKEQGRESHISVDSLDMDAYPDDGEIILTCNKDNYTIAFEGSVLYSDDSFYGE